MEDGFRGFRRRGENGGNDVTRVRVAWDREMIR
jgi:hypothetical protein